MDQRQSVSESGGIAKKTGSLLLFRFATIVLQGLTAVLAARALGSDGRGVLATASTGPAIIAIALALGFGVSNVYYVARKEVDVSVAIATSLVAVLLTGLVVAPLYITVALLLQDGPLHGLPTPFIFVGGFMIPTLLAVRYVFAVAQGLQRIDLLNSVTVVQSAVVAVLYLVFLVGLGRGAFAAFAIILFANLISIVPVLLILARNHGRWRFKREYLARAIRFGAKGEASNLIAFLGYRIDLLIVAAMLGFAAAGHYAVAFTGAELLWVVPAALAVVLFPAIAAQPVSDSHVSTTSEILRMTTLLLMVFGVVGCVLAPIVIPLVFSSQYQASVLPLELLVPGVVLFGVGKVLAADLAGRGRPGVTSVANGIGVIVMVALDFLLIPHVGVAGAAAASSFAYGLVFFLQARIFRQLTGEGVASVLLPRRADFARIRSAFIRSRQKGSPGPARPAAPGGGVCGG